MNNSASFSRPWRITGIAGLLFVLASILAFALNVQPPTYDQNEVFKAWYSENNEKFRTGHFVAGLAFILFYFPFYAGLCERLRLAEAVPAIWSRVTWAGAIISAAAGTTAGAFIIGIAFLGAQVSADVAALATASNFYAYVVSGALSSIAMIGASMVILQTGIFQRWLGWTGMFIGLIAILGCAAVVENDPNGLFAVINSVAWLAYFFWIAAMSVSLIRANGVNEKPNEFSKLHGNKFLT